MHKFLCRRECANLLSTPFPRFSCSEGKPVPEAEVICNCFYIVCLGALFGESISAHTGKALESPNLVGYGSGLGLI